MGQTRHGDVVVELDGAVARVLIDRPEAKNSLSPAVLDGLRAAVESALEARCSVFVLRGAGGTLSAGADLPTLGKLLSDPEGLHAYVGSIGGTLEMIEAAPFVSICVVSEYALAGGCEVLLACDLAVASEESKIGDRHLQYGLIPGGGGSVRLPRALPGPLARRLLYTGEMIDGATAAQWGLVSHAVPAAELDDTVEALVARLSRHGREALVGMKHLYRAGLDTEPGQALTAERDYVVDYLTTSRTAAEGISAFQSGRKPDFSNL